MTGFLLVTVSAISEDFFSSRGFGGCALLLCAVLGGVLKEFSWGGLKIKTFESPYRYWASEKFLKG